MGEDNELRGLPLGLLHKFIEHTSFKYRYPFSTKMIKRIVSILAILTIIISLFANMGAHAQGGSDKEKSPYPTITLYFADGKKANITGKIWSGTVFPLVEGMIKDYNWVNKIKYLFFDYSLKGLNPYGLDFVRAMEEKPYSEFENNFVKLVGYALNATEYLDSDGDGYLNIDELNAGTYPGDPNDYPGKNTTNTLEENLGYIILIVLIASVFALYFIFGREKKE